jgi:predicted DNA-binding transcriptional regulator AlpA
MNNSDGTTLEIEGTRYFSGADVTREAGISRQTLWRWRQEGKIPQGHRYRDGRVLFTQTELDAIRDFANRIEPINEASAGQLKLFGRSTAV